MRFYPIAGASFAYVQAGSADPIPSEPESGTQKGSPVIARFAIQNSEE